jgi:hypothetical protein
LPRPAGSPPPRRRDVAEKAEVLITSLPNVDAFEQVMAARAASPRGLTAALDQGGRLLIE